MSIHDILPQPTIAERRAQLESNIRAAEARVIVAKAELSALQHECPHVSGRKVKVSDYTGSSDTYHRCADCGMDKLI